VRTLQSISRSSVHLDVAFLDKTEFLLLLFVANCLLFLHFLAACAEVHAEVLFIEKEGINSLVVRGCRWLLRWCYPVSIGGRWRYHRALALQGPEGLVLMLPNLLVRYAVISNKWVGMTVNDPSHPSMPLHLCILNRALVRIDGQPEWLNFL